MIAQVKGLHKFPIFYLDSYKWKFAKEFDLCKIDCIIKSNGHCQKKKMGQMGKIPYHPH